jgi:hypothetical protein
MLMLQRTTASRALSRAIEELERIHIARKDRESSAASPAAESALPITVEEQSASQVENTAVSESSAAEGPFPPGVFRAVTYRVTG